MEPLSAYIPTDRYHAWLQGENLPDRAIGAALLADISSFTPLTKVLVQELGPGRGAETLIQYLNTVYSGLIAEVHQYGGSVVGFSGDAITCWFNASPAAVAQASRQAVACGLAMQQVMSQLAPISLPSSRVVPVSIKVAVASGPVRRFLVGDPHIQYLDVLAGTTIDRLASVERQAQKNEVLVSPEIMAQLGAQVEGVTFRLDGETNQPLTVIAGLTGGAAPAARVTLEEVTPSTSHPIIRDLDPPPSAPPVEQLAETQERAWLLLPVYQRLKSGQEQFLAELRPVVALFLRFMGLDYDQDEAAGAKLDAYIRWVQNVLARYEGYLIQLTHGDKGSYLYAAFGAPLAHGDDAVRAVAAARELRSPPLTLNFISQPQIGLSQGRMHAGTYGSSTRCTYGILGDEVNVAARLMELAGPGQLLVSQRVADRAARYYHFKDLGSVTVKGQPDPLPIFLNLDEQGISIARSVTRFTTPLVGRYSELAQLEHILIQAIRGQTQIVQLEGVAGVGKSRLIAALAERASRHGVRVVLGASQSTSQEIAYFPWQQIFRVLFALSDELPHQKSVGMSQEELSSTETSQNPQASDGQSKNQNSEVAQVETSMAQLNPDWLTHLPVLADLLNLPIPNNSITAAFEPQLRQEILFALAGELLKTWAQSRPLLLLIEDAHWLDEASQALTSFLSRSLATTPIMLILTHRPLPQPLLPDLNRLPVYYHLRLPELMSSAVVTLVSERLQGPVSALAMALIEVQTQGNPFFIEELVAALREAGHLQCLATGVWDLAEPLITALQQANCLLQDARSGQWLLSPNAPLAAVELGMPDSIHGLVLARLDRLPEAHRLTLKAASVIGPAFSFDLLAQVHPWQPEPAMLLAQLEFLQSQDMIHQAAPAPRLSYVFKHHITQEAAYKMLLFAQRHQLNRAVAEWYEHKFGGAGIVQPPPEGLVPYVESALTPYYSLLVHHWHEAENRERERHYAWLAGQRAAAQFANAEAVNYFSRVLKLTPATDVVMCYDVLLAREMVNDLRGKREAQAQDLATLASLVEEMNDDQRRVEIALRQANYAEAISDYSVALVAAQQAIKQAIQAHDPVMEAAGYIAWGKALWYQGDYEAARIPLEQALIRAASNYHAKAKSLHYLGNIYLYQNNYSAAQAHYQQALDIHRTIGHRQGEADSLTNLGLIQYELGDYSAARDYFEQVLAIFHTTGDRRGEATVLGNLGNLYCDLGDYAMARDRQERALDLRLAIADRWGEALSLTNLGLVYHRLGQHEIARQQCEQALVIQREIGDRRDEGYCLTYLGHALAGLSELKGAASAYEEALRLRHELGQPRLAIDDLVGLAIVALAQGHNEQARTYVEDILAWLEANGPAGIEYPLHAYLTCYRVLNATANGRGEVLEQAQAILTKAYTALMDQAAGISDPTLRQSFLENVATNREIMAAWVAKEAAVEY